jgi:nitrogen regulatory protein P-II 1
MKEIRAIIRPNQLDKLRQALRALPDFPGLTVFKGEGFTAPSKVIKRTDAEELTDYSPKLLVCCVADDLAVASIQRIIIEQCKTGQTGDGLVWTLDVGSAIKIKDASPLAL